MLTYSEVDRFVKQNVLQNMTMLVNELFISGVVEYSELYNYNIEEGQIYEWWLVSEYLAEKLKAKNKVILPFAGFNFFWGRTCTGQSISLDGIIQEVAEDILY